MGKGDIYIQNVDNSTQVISSVFYVPKLGSNLLNVGQLQEKGFTITIKDGVYLIKDPKRGAIAHVKMTAYRMFP